MPKARDSQSQMVMISNDEYQSLIDIRDRENGVTTRTTRTRKTKKTLTGDSSVAEKPKRSIAKKKAPAKSKSKGAKKSARATATTKRRVTKKQDQLQISVKVNK